MQTIARVHLRVLATALTLAAGIARANNVVVSNVSAAPRDGATASVSFDIAWEHSWSFATVNHDAAWVFFKAQRSGSTTWTNHVVLAGSGVNPAGYATGTGTSIELVIPSDGMGLFVRRSTDGSGSVSVQGVTVVCNIAASGLSQSEGVKLQAMAVEMVYVAEGPFKVGSGSATDVGSFTDGSWTAGAPIPLAITSETALTVAQTAGNLWGISATGASTFGGAGTLPAAFPKGYGGFYCMKYEISEGQWVDFFNTLTDTQKITRDITQGVTVEVEGKKTDAVSFRNTVAWATGDATTTAPDRGCSYLNWNDNCAYADWAGLRPMTELEFEKACRGPSTPVAAEYPWGSVTITTSTAAITNDGTGRDTAAGNANSLASLPDGPYRVGIYATPSSTRQQAGATYWGILDLGGNLWDRTVSVGHVDGRAFTGLHGDGGLTTNGNANVANWPAVSAAFGSGVASGSGARGGGWNVGANTRLQTSDRNGGTDGFNNRTKQHGGRVVRSAPSGGLVTQAEVAGSTDRFLGGSYDGWSRSLMSEYKPVVPKGTLILLQ